MSRTLTCAALFSLLAALSVGCDDTVRHDTSTSQAQHEGGGVLIRIPDGTTQRCVNASADRVWLTLYRVITTRSKHWLTQENDVAIVINAQVKTDPQPAKPISFPLMSQARIGSYPTGQISVPVEYTIVSGLNLKQGEVSYAGLGVDVSLVNLRGKNKLGVALEVLAQITGSGKLPIPSSPYTQAATYLLDFANTAVNKDIENQNKDDKSKTGSISLNFDPEGQCGGPSPGGIGFETTGTKAIVMAEGAPGDGLVDIGHPDDFCWGMEPEPAFVVEATKKDPSIPSCSDPRYATKFRAITNNYTAFFLQKRPMKGHLGAEAVDERDRSESLRRCRTLGIKESECPGLKD